MAGPELEVGSLRRCDGNDVDDVVAAHGDRPGADVGIAEGSVWCVAASTRRQPRRRST